MPSSHNCFLSCYFWTCQIWLTLSSICLIKKLRPINAYTLWKFSFQLFHALLLQSYWYLWVLKFSFQLLHTLLLYPSINILSMSIYEFLTFLFHLLHTFVNASVSEHQYFVNVYLWVPNILVSFTAFHLLSMLLYQSINILSMSIYEFLTFLFHLLHTFVNDSVSKHQYLSMSIYEFLTLFFHLLHASVNASVSKHQYFVNVYEF